MKKNSFKKIIACYCAIVFALVAQGQRKTENLVIVTLDGMRWHEVFKAAVELRIVSALISATSAASRDADVGSRLPVTTTASAVRVGRRHA